MSRIAEHVWYGIAYGLICLGMVLSAAGPDTFWGGVAAFAFGFSAALEPTTQTFTKLWGRLSRKALTR